MTMVLSRLVLTAFVVLGVGSATFAADKVDKVDNKKLLTGKWEVSEGAEETLAKGSTAEFTADGKFKVLAKKNNQDENIEGSYTLEGDALSLMMKRNDEERTVKITIKKISDTDLTLEGPDGKSVSFKKKK